MENWELEYKEMSKNESFMVILDYKDFNARIEIHHFSIEKFSPIKGVSLDSSMEDFKLVVVAKIEF